MSVIAGNPQYRPTPVLSVALTRPVIGSGGPTRLKPQGGLSSYACAPPSVLFLAPVSFAPSASTRRTRPFIDRSGVMSGFLGQDDETLGPITDNILDPINDPTSTLSSLDFPPTPLGFPVDTTPIDTISMPIS